MTADKLADAILNKCDIYYGGALISKEAIIEKYLAFFAKSLVSKERTTNFALHTGSVCFDVISVVAVALGCLSYNLSTNDDIISSLQPNDMVLFKGQRYRWKGTGFEYGSLCMILEQDGKGKNGKTTSYLPLDRNKHLIKPYYGDSQVTDGRGVKKRSTNREDFLSYIFDVDVVEIPTQIDVSVVIVAERNSFGEICKQVRIAYGDGKAVSLLDIIPAAYYTGSGDEYQYGLNPTKAEPVLKVTGKISTARDLVLDNHGNKVVGLLVTGGISLSENNSELADLLRRKLLRFVHVISPLKADIGERILEIYDEASVFACTKELLSQNSQMIRSENPLTVELHRQIMNVIHNTVTPIVVSGGWEWTEYRRIKSAILTIRQSNWQDSEKDDFVITAYGLLNLMNTALFSMEEMEKAIDERRIHQAVLPPQERIARLWDIAERAGSLQDLWSDFFPTVEIPSMSFSLPQNGLIKDEELSMKYLSDLDPTDRSTKLASMRSLVDLYRNWVDDLERVAATLDSRYESAAANNIGECRRAYKRMYAGIDSLEQNDEAYTAFLLANRAMFMQRIHIAMQGSMSKTNADRYPGDEEIADRLHGMDYGRESDDKCRWRPFQIAFLLMDINSIIDDESPERSIVDLIWFPTGGGKTEAYLGLTAFTIFYRKLAHPKNSNGTAVIMRYTLRLLAAQQFTRAATLICACEYIRQDCAQKRHKYPSYPLGKEPITIGLWIGGSHIPNKNVGTGERSNSAEYHLGKLQSVSSPYYVRNEKERHNKFQVLKCPWCGTKMVKDDKNGRLVGEWGYNMSGGKHFYMFCPHEDCAFTKRLPIQIIDDELYEAPPTLLFGTVDKFAMLPWDGRIGAFFGIGKDNRTPELIIQDELHLISGALGTVVGLYETAVDAICGQKGVYPKVIASTATIRRAKEQCSVLYNREVVQFPAPGLDAEDSFFAKESAVDYEKGDYGRKYVGIMPSGKTKAMMGIRTMAALMQKIYIMDLSEEVKDKLWTLTVYFNSLKDLGKASTLVDDDVKDFIVRTANRMFTGRRLIVSADELTSRVSTTALNETLDKLEKIEYSKENEAAKRYASNVLLATNMISVGIDVARLNVMLMIGQPKLTSEYIQASSRVGRSFPGVVFVQYDATKSRDRSHYERFRSYHESFYRFVEPTGATPFSRPARERALHAVLVSMMRQMTGMSEDKDAINFDKEYFADTIKQIETFVTDRVTGINERSEGQAKDDVNEIRTEIEEFFDLWQSYVDECNGEHPSVPLYFGRRFMVNPPAGDARRLLKQYNSSGKDSAVETLTSMRNVDTPVSGSIIVWGDNNV